VKLKIVDTTSPNGRPACLVYRAEDYAEYEAGKRSMFSPDRDTGLRAVGIIIKREDQTHFFLHTNDTIGTTPSFGRDFDSLEEAKSYLEEIAA